MSTGVCKDHAAAIFNFNNMFVHLHGDDKNMFTMFIKRMLKWDLEERSTAKECSKTLGFMQSLRKIKVTSIAKVVLV